MLRMMACLLGSLLFVCTHEKQPLTELWRKTVLSLQLVTIACYACGSFVAYACMFVHMMCSALCSFLMMMTALDL